MESEIESESTQEQAPREELLVTLEQWYQWLTSNPDVLFDSDDVKRLQSPVVYFHKANNWLSRTTMLNADWFFKEGSDIVMKRWKEGEYDAYDS